MRRESSAVWAIAAGSACAGLLWASQSLADFVRRPTLSWASVATGAAFKARPRADTTSSAHPQTGATFGARAWGRIASSAGGWAGAAPGALAHGGAGAAASSMQAASPGPPIYSMSAPQYLSDPAAARARSIAVGDVSGDGRDDLVFLSARYVPGAWLNGMDVYVAYQRSDGSLEPAVKIGESGTELDFRLLIADLDRNGIGDIVTTTSSGVMVFYANADGRFTSSLTVVGDPDALVATDVDRDGYLDVLVDASDTTASVLHGGPRGVERTSTLPLPASAVRTTGDVTGDGLDDLILATIFNRPLREFRVYPALASGGYAAPLVHYGALDANQTGSLVTGDFNGDGRIDLALDEAKDYADVHLYFQDAQGTLSSTRDIARNRGGGSLVVHDLDRDGRSDLAIAHNGWGYVGYYLQTDTGFTPQNVINVNQYMGRSNYFAAGDLNHDGCGDLVISRDSQSPVLLYGQGCAPAVVADCRYPEVAVEAAGPVATAWALPLARVGSGGAGAQVRGRSMSDAGERFGRDGHGLRSVSASGRAGRGVMER